MSPAKKNTGAPALELEKLLALRGASVSISDLQGKTSCISYWEELHSAGLNPDTRTLHAVVSIRCATGYNLELSNRPNEHVRFFLDIGSGFQDAGLCSFCAPEVPDCIVPEHPFFYLVARSIPQRFYRQLQQSQATAILRAVLSWNAIPSRNPDELPLFGNRLDSMIQLEKKAVANIAAVLSKPPVSCLSSAERAIVLPAATPNRLPVVEPAGETAAVPEHRQAFAAVQQLFQAGKTDGAGSAGTAVTLEQVLSVAAAPRASTEFEQLTSVALSASIDCVGATVLLKKHHGYAEFPGRTGWEHVAFWADCNNDGVFEEYLGMASVEIRESGRALPRGGLCYSVSVPVPENIRVLKARGIFKSVRIRAVLSWAVPPSMDDPEVLSVWGNRLEAQVSLATGGTPKDGRGRVDPDFLAWLAKLRPSPRKDGDAALKQGNPTGEERSVPGDDLQRESQRSQADSHGKNTGAKAAGV